MNKRTKGKRVVIVAGTFLVVVLLGTVWISWDHIRFWWLFEPLGNNDQGYPEYRHRQTGVVMVRVPGGTFRMGTSESQRNAVIREFKTRPPPLQSGVTAQIFGDFLDNEQPDHDVTLSSFLIAKYEVDQLVWKKAMLSEPSLRPGGSLPVHKVLWSECLDFCEKTGLSLPTEAQWEYACRAGSKSAFAFGEKIDGKQANLDNPSGIVEVRSNQPNPFGIHNMHGNVSEWCSDYFHLHDNFYEKPEATLENPRNGSPSEYRVRRGGSFHMKDYFCRSAFRSGAPESRRIAAFTGFRPAYYPLP